MRSSCSILFLLLISRFGFGQLDTELIATPFSNTENGIEYLSPLNDVFGSFLHSGVFPRLSEEGFHIKVGLHISRINLSDDFLTFAGETTGLNENQVVKASTILGDTEQIEVIEGSESFVFPGGAGIENFTFAAPELFIGTLVGTDLYGRYIYFPIEGSIGNVEFYGGGIRHDFGRYFLPEYMKWHLAYNYHMLNYGDNIKSVNQYALTQLGFQLNRIGLYGLFGFEMNKMNVAYDLSEPEQDVNVDVTDNMPYRYGGGINLSFKFFEVYGEYNMNDPVNIVFGVSLGI